RSAAPALAFLATTTLRRPFETQFALCFEAPAEAALDAANTCIRKRCGYTCIRANSMPYHFDNHPHYTQIPHTPLAQDGEIEVTDELLRRIPKTDLHVHLDGSLRIETLIDLADKYGVDLP